MELPRYNGYWRVPRVKRLLKAKRVHNACFDGCQYGLQPVGADPSSCEYLRKPWRFASTIPHVADWLCKLCPGTHPEHKHVTTRGKNALHSQYYTPEIAVLVHISIFHYFLDKFDVNMSQYADLSNSGDSSSVPQNANNEDEQTGGPISQNNFQQTGGVRSLECAPSEYPNTSIPQGPPATGGRGGHNISGAPSLGALDGAQFQGPSGAGGISTISNRHKSNYCDIKLYDYANYDDSEVVKLVCCCIGISNDTAATANTGGDFDDVAQVIHNTSTFDINNTNKAYSFDFHNVAISAEFGLLSEDLLFRGKMADCLQSKLDTQVKFIRVSVRENNRGHGKRKLPTLWRPGYVRDAIETSIHEFLPKSIDYHLFAFLQDVGYTISEGMFADGGVDSNWFMPKSLCRDHYFTAGIMNFLLTNRGEVHTADLERHRIMSGVVDAGQLQLAIR